MITRQEFEDLWWRAREIDRQEWGGDMEQAWRCYLWAAHHNYNGPPQYVTVDGQIEAIWGKECGSSKWLWFLGSNKANKFPKALTQELQIRAERDDRVRLLASNTLHIRWLERCGFVLSHHETPGPYIVMEKV